MFNSRTQDLLGNADPSHDVKGVPLLSPVEHHHFELVAVFLAYRNVICTEDIGEALKSIGDVLARCFHTCSFLIPGRTKMSVRSCLHILVEAGHFHPESNLRKHFSNLSDKQVRLLDPRVPRPISAGTALVKMGVKEKGRIAITLPCPLNEYILNSFNPVYLPAYLQFLALHEICAQIENACFGFVKRIDRPLLKKHGLKIPKSADISRWWEMIREMRVPRDEIDAPWLAEINSAFRGLRKVRNGDAHRVQEVQSVPGAVRHVIAKPSAY